MFNIDEKMNRTIMNVISSRFDMTRLPICCLWIYFACLRCVQSEWPLLNSTATGVNLLGLFANAFESTVSSPQCRAMFQSAVILSQRLNLTVNDQLIGYHSEQTNGDAMKALSLTCRFVSNSNLVGIIGPESSRESHLIARFASQIGVPVVSYGATDPELADRSIYPMFFRTISSDDTAVRCLVDLFIRFNWTSCIIIYQNDEFGNGGARAISEMFNSHRFNISQTILFDIRTQTIRSKLKHLRTNNPTRIVVVWAMKKYATMIVQQALEGQLLGKEQFIWILNSDIDLSSFHEKSYDKFNGLLIVEPVIGNLVNEPINQTLLTSVIDIWNEYESETFPGVNQIDYYALLTFDATWSLIQALTSRFTSSISFANQSFCFDRQLLDSSLYFNSIINQTFLGVSGYVQFDRNQADRINGTYYLLKNLQYSSNVLNTVPVLVWSEVKHWIPHSRQNVIVWPGNYLYTPSDYASLDGLSVRIAVIISHPFAMLKQDAGKFDRGYGYIPDLIRLLEQQMHFKPNITLLSPNGSYNRIIDDVINDIYDMVIADMTITAKRMEKVSFSNSIFDNSLRLIIRESSMIEIDFLSFLRPFSFQLWLALLFATIYSGFLICLVEREHNESLRSKSLSSLLLLSLWYSLGTILGYGVDFHVQTAPGRLLTVGLYLLSLISVAAYTANLASDLTIAKTNKIISGIDDIRKGQIESKRIGILVNTSIEDYYLREISDGKKNYYPLTNRHHLYESFLQNQIDVAIMDSGAAEYTVNHNCNLTLVGNDFDKNSFGIAFRKDSFFEQYFDIAILSLRESGQLDALRHEWFQQNSCSSPHVSFSSMTVESLAGLFLIFGVLSLLSIVLFLWKHRQKIKDSIRRIIRSDE